MEIERTTRDQLNKKSSQLTQNVTSLTIGQGITFILNFFSIVIAARYLGVDNFGLFTSLLAVITIISKAIDFGLSPIAFREHSRQSGQFGVINSAISIRIVLSLIFILCANVLFFVLEYSFNEYLLSNLLFLNVFFSFRMANFTDILNIPFKVRFKMLIPMSISVLESTLVLLFVLSMIVFRGGLLYFTIGYTLANLPGFIILIIIAKQKFGYHFRFDLTKYKWLIAESLPLSGFVILTVVFQQLDVILLKYMQSNSDAGVFSAALRLTLPMNIIPTSIVMTIFPLIVKNIEKKNVQKNNELISFSFKALFLIAFFVFIVFMFKSEEIINLVFGEEYSAASFPAIILLFSQMFLFFNFLGIDLLTAHSKQRHNFYYALVLVIVNIVLSLVLIPILSYNGASISKAISAIISFVLLFTLLGNFNIQRNFGDKKLVLWSVLFCLIVFALSHFHLSVYLIGVVVLIVLLLVWSPLLSNKDKKYIKDNFLPIKFN